jgi:hypothetical protein
MYYAYFPEACIDDRGPVTLARVGNPPIYHTHLLDGLADRCSVEGACRLRQDAAVKGRSSNELNGGLAQNDALNVCTCAHRDHARDLPEDILCKCAALQDHSFGRIYAQVPRHLNDEDVGDSTFEVDATGDVDVRIEGVDAGRQPYLVEFASTDIELRIAGTAPRGISVCG